MLGLVCPPDSQPPDSTASNHRGVRAADRRKGLERGTRGTSSITSLDLSVRSEMEGEEGLLRTGRGGTSWLPEHSAGHTLTLPSPSPDGGCSTWKPRCCTEPPKVSGPPDSSKAQVGSPEWPRGDALTQVRVGGAGVVAVEGTQELE